MANRQQRRKLKETRYEEEDNYNNIIIILVVVIAVFGLFYLITVAVNNKNRKLNTKEAEKEAVSIQYDEILADNLFNMPLDTYYVFFYKKDGNNMSYYSYLTTSNVFSEKIYTVNLSDGLNKKYISEDTNPSVTDINSLRVNEPTLIKISNKEVVLYLEDIDLIESELTNKEN